MKWFTLIMILLSFNVIAVNEYDLIEDDYQVCGAIESGSFKKMQNFLMKKYNLTVEEAYLKIVFDDNDLMGMVVDEPTNRIELAVGLRRYFKKKLKKPELFSQALLSEVSGRDILRRIELSLASVRESEETMGGDLGEGLFTC